MSAMRDSWLAPWRPFDVAAFLARIRSPRLVDMPELARWIDEAARANDLRAEWLLALIQKEQSALTARALSQHGRDWLCGYGYTEGRIYSQYRGAEQQVRSAARGLRRYLTPGDPLYVGGRVGREWRDLDGIIDRIPNVAASAALQYTPHWSTLQTMERLWREFGFEDGGTMTQAQVATVARDVVRRVAAGESTVRIGAATWEARWRNYCSRFVRLCHGAVTGVLWPGWAGAYATWTERSLRQQGYQINGPVEGCIVAFNGDAYRRYGQATIEGASEAWMDARPAAHGHVAIYIGDGRIAENGAAGYRTRTLDEAGRGRITGYYAPLPVAAPEVERETLVVLMDPDSEWGRPYEVMIHEDGRLFIPARQALEDLGYEVAYRGDRTYAKPTPAVLATAQRMTREVMVDEEHPEPAGAADPA